MAKSAALNPASIPFFPGEAIGGKRASYGQVSSSSSASDYRSVRSTPSPAHQLDTDNPRHSPTLRHTDSQKPYPLVEPRIIRDPSMFGSLDTLPEKDEKSYGEEDDLPGHQTPSPGSYPARHQNQVPLEQGPPFLPFSRNNEGKTFSSPVPGPESNYRATPIAESPIQNTEDHLRASPLIQDILDRMIRYEYVSREIQQDLSDLNRKVNILIERAVSTPQPEFKDPFAPASSSSLQPRPSVGNIAPNQAANSDDMSSISQRLNTLTSSVGQLLALQTQQIHQQNITSPEARNSVISLNVPSSEIPPNQLMPPPSNSTILGHNLPGRPDIRQGSRQQNQGSRMWVSGTLELPIRSSVQEVGNKRRSSGLVRRDSAGVGY